MSDDSLDEVSKKLADAIRPVTEFRIHKLERRIVEPMDKDRKKTTKELQDESKKLLEEGAVLQKESEKTLERLTMMIEGERISFTRTSPTRTRDMTIYFDKLTDEQKQKLERIDQALFDMAEKVTERGTRTLKDDGAVKE